MGDFNFVANLLVFGAFAVVGFICALHGERVQAFFAKQFGSDDFFLSKPYLTAIRVTGIVFMLFGGGAVVLMLFAISLDQLRPG